MSVRTLPGTADGQCICRVRSSHAAMRLATGSLCDGLRARLKLSRATCAVLTTGRRPTGSLHCLHLIFFSVQALFDFFQFLAPKRPPKAVAPEAAFQERISRKVFPCRLAVESDSFVTPLCHQCIVAGVVIGAGCEHQHRNPIIIFDTGVLGFVDHLQDEVR